MHTDRTLNAKEECTQTEHYMWVKRGVKGHKGGSKQGEIQFSDARTDRQTETQVHVLSCAFAAKNY